MSKSPRLGYFWHLLFYMVGLKVHCVLVTIVTILFPSKSLPYYNSVLNDKISFAVILWFPAFLLQKNSRPINQLSVLSLLWVRTSIFVRLVCVNKMFDDGTGGKYPGFFTFWYIYVTKTVKKCLQFVYIFANFACEIQIKLIQLNV
jgi:hypothetical protein